MECGAEDGLWGYVVDWWCLTEKVGSDDACWEGLDAIVRDG